MNDSLIPHHNVFQSREQAGEWILPYFFLYLSAKNGTWIDSFSLLKCLSVLIKKYTRQTEENVAFIKNHLNASLRYGGFPEAIGRMKWLMEKPYVLFRFGNGFSILLDSNMKIKTYWG